MTNRLGFPYTPFDSGVKTGPVDFLSGVQSSWGVGTSPLGFSFNMTDSLLSPGTPPELSLDTLRHTIPEVGPSPSFTIDYSRYDEELGSQFNSVEGIISSQYTDTEKLHSSYGTQFHISGFNRSNMYIANIDEPSIPVFNQFTRGSVGLGKIGLTSPNFNPFEFGIDLPYVIPQITATGPQTDSKVFSNTPKLANAHGSDFMTLPISGYNGLYMGSQGDIVPIIPSVIGLGEHTGPSVVGGGVIKYGSLRRISNFSGLDSTINDLYPSPSGKPSDFSDTQITLNIPQIVLTGPFGDEDYQSSLNITPIAEGAHGNRTIPLESYTTQYEGSLITINRDEVSVTPATWLDSLEDQFDFNTPSELEQLLFGSPDSPTISQPVYTSGTVDISSDNINFGSFTPSDTPLLPLNKLSPHWDPDGNNFFTFPTDRAPYNILHRNITGTWNAWGFLEKHLGLDSGQPGPSTTQPYILRKIGERWGNDGDSHNFVDHIVSNLVNSVTTAAARTVADEIRISAWEGSPRGIQWVATQAALQAFNPRKETRIWNPASIQGSLPPMFHVQRHLGDTYSDVTKIDLTEGGDESSILTDYSYNLDINNGLHDVNKRRRGIEAMDNQMVFPTPIPSPTTWPTDLGVSGPFDPRRKEFVKVKDVGPNLGTTYDTAKVFLDGQNLYFRKRGTEEDSQYLKSHGAGSISPMTLGQRGSSTPSGILYYDTGGYGRSMARQSISGVYQGDKYSATSPYLTNLSEVQGVGVELGSVSQEAKGLRDKGLIQITGKGVIYKKRWTHSFPSKTPLIWSSTTDFIEDKSLENVKGTGVYQGDAYSSTSPYLKEHGTPPYPKKLSAGEKALGHTSTPKAKQKVIFINKKSPISTDFAPITGQVGEISTMFDHERTHGDGITTTGPVTQPDGNNVYKKDILYLTSHGSGTIIPTGKLAEEQKGFSIGQRIGDPTFTNKVTAYTTEPTSITDGKFPSTRSKIVYIGADTQLHDGKNDFNSDKSYLSGGNKLGQYGDLISGVEKPTTVTKTVKAVKSLFSFVSSIVSEAVTGQKIQQEGDPGPESSIIILGSSTSGKARTKAHFGLTIKGATDKPFSWKGDSYSNKLSYTESGEQPAGTADWRLQLGRVEKYSAAKKNVIHVSDKFSFGDNEPYVVSYDPLGKIEDKAPYFTTPIGAGKITAGGFQGDLYGDGSGTGDNLWPWAKGINKYSIAIASSKEQPQSSPLEFTRLQIDDKTGDPTVVIKTSHPQSSARFQTAGTDTLKEPIKLQDFPLLNKQGNDKNFGKEGQSLGFVQGTYGLFGNLFGHKDRYGHGQQAENYKEKVDKDDPSKNKGQLLKSPSELALNVKDDNITIDKIISYNHQPERSLDQVVPVQSDLTIEKTEGFKTTKVTKNLGKDLAIKELGATSTEGSGNLLDRYSTLAYGKLNVRGVDPAGDTTHGQLNYEKTLRSASELNQSPRSSELASESHPEGVAAPKNQGRRDKSKQHKADAQGHPGKSDVAGAVTTVNDEGLKGLVKKSGGKYVTALTDKINMLRYGEDYQGSDTDFVKFKFRDLINDKFIIFRASLSSISEEFSPEWSSEKYIGRPDQVHVYQGVNRSLSFEFMVVPHTRQELPILWEKLNYLVGLTYPTWKNIGEHGKRMESPFVNLTIGDMYNAVPGFLSGLSISVDDNGTWEIEEGFQLPKAINVSCEFTHIGQHVLASQGKHYDLGWLKEYNNTDEWITGDSHLFDRTDNSLNSLLNLPPTTEESYESDASYMTGNGAASNAAAANQNMGGG